jgi:phosphate starvation-inducible PhoH-like protein
MRGRTLNDSFIILDEAQNTTSEQMKMFLTRMGYNSQAVVTGDITQIDLPRNKTSGLKEAQHVLKGIDGIKIIRFSKQDVVRHSLVQDIIEAYERANADQRPKDADRNPTGTIQKLENAGITEDNQPPSATQEPDVAQEPTIAAS